MFAKQKSYLIIDIEKQKKISGVSDAQEKSSKHFKIKFFIFLDIKYQLKPIFLTGSIKFYTFLKMEDES